MPVCSDHSLLSKQNNFPEFRDSRESDDPSLFADIK